MRRTLASLWLIALTACTGELTQSETLFHTADMSGSLSIPLDGHDAQGRSYRLRSATFEVNGSAMMTLSQSGGSRQRELKAPLPGGSYEVFLRPGYELVEVAADGSEQPVAVLLSSANPGTLQLSERADRALGLAFRRPEGEQGGTITFGPQPGPRWARGNGATSVLASAPSSR